MTKMRNLLQTSKAAYFTLSDLPNRVVQGLLAVWRMGTFREQVSDDWLSGLSICRFALRTWRGWILFNSKGNEGQRPRTGSNENKDIREMQYVQRSYSWTPHGVAPVLWLPWAFSILPILQSILASPEDAGPCLAWVCCISSIVSWMYIILHPISRSSLWKGGID